MQTNFIIIPYYKEYFHSPDDDRMGVATIKRLRELYEAGRYLSSV